MADRNFGGILYDHTRTFRFAHRALGQWRPFKRSVGRHSSLLHTLPITKGEAQKKTSTQKSQRHKKNTCVRGSKTVKAYYRRVLYRAWGLTAHRGWARLMLDRRNLVQAPNAPRDQSQHPRARNDYDEETAYESYMNPEPGFQSGPGDTVDAD